MTALYRLSELAFDHVLHAGWQAALLGAIVLTISGLLGRFISARWQFALWMVVFVKLAVPVFPASPWSLFNCPAVFVSTLADRTTANNELAPPLMLPVAGPGIPPASEDILPVNIATIAPGLAGVPSQGESRFAPFHWLVLGWAIGAGFLLLRRLRQTWLVARLARQWHRVDDPHLLNLLDEAQRQAGVGRCVQLVGTPDGVGPAAIGWWRPRILLPQSLLAKLSSDELRFVLLHELSHVRRHDVLIDWLASLVAIFHWVNPIAWLALARVRWLRELACDAAVLDVVSVAQQQRYGLAVLKVAEQLIAPWPLPSSAGAFGRRACLTKRIRAIRNHRSPSGFASAAGFGVVLALVAVGLTDAWQPPAAMDDARPAKLATKDIGALGESEVLTFSGICRDGNGDAMRGVTIRLYRWRPVIDGGFELLAEQVTHADGHFSFPDLPKPNDQFDEFFRYCAIGTSPGRATDFAWITPGYETTDLHELQHPPAATLAGRVTNRRGDPVANAAVWVLATPGYGPAPGLWQAKTDAGGRYAITDLPPGEDLDKEDNYELKILHSDYERATQPYTQVPDTMDVVLDRGGTIEGRVIDAVASQPAANVLVSLQGCKGTVAGGQTRTDNQGRYRLSSLLAGTYNVWADAPDRACAAIEAITVAPAQTASAPDLNLVEGGWIEGRVIDAETGEPISRHPENGRAIPIGWYGPARPRSSSACQAKTVDDRGKFRLRVAPGTNYPYIMFADLWKRTWPRTSYTDGIEVKSGEVKSVAFSVFRHPQPTERGRSPGELPLPVAREREAAEAIRQLGGWYALDEEQYVVDVNMVFHETSDGTRYDNPQTHTDAAVQHLHSLSRLKRLFLKQGQAADRSMRQIGERRNLELLMIWDAVDVTDEGVSQLTGLVNLNHLHIGDSNLTDRSLATLSQLPRLEHLAMQGNNFTDEGLKHLREMQQLRSLWAGLGESHFSDAGLAHLADLEHLEELCLQGSPITDAGLVHLSKLSNLRSLYLSRPESANEHWITDNSLPVLTSFQRMERLCLQGTQITDEGVRSLGRLPALEYLQLSSPSLSAMLDDQMKRDRPKVRFLLIADPGHGLPESQK